jgi:hypothetical protein
MLGLQGNNPNNNGYVATTYFEYHGVEPGAYYGLEYRRVSNFRAFRKFGIDYQPFSTLNFLSWFLIRES